MCLRLLVEIQISSSEIIKYKWIMLCVISLEIRVRRQQKAVFDRYFPKKWS